ncbi:RidA family protein [Nocardia miyunensis]|uniref:RidA family protein n=1 Tax=Nocardia miyunensis TaxID=282684 RepID=UPI00082DFF7B|nr:RidA family protein [Nocardia miyunensis]
MAQLWRENLTRLGLELPAVAAPAGVYIPAQRSGSHVYTSGQLPFVGGELSVVGKVGAEVSLEQAREAAKQCALNALAAVHDLVGLDSVVRIVKVVGFVASAPGFNNQPQVINGASELLGELFGASGAHARSAVGVFELPANTPVEVELIAEVS